MSINIIYTIIKKLNNHTTVVKLFLHKNIFLFYQFVALKLKSVRRIKPNVHVMKEIVCEKIQQNILFFKFF